MKDKRTRKQSIGLTFILLFLIVFFTIFFIPQQAFYEPQKITITLAFGDEQFNYGNANLPAGLYNYKATMTATGSFSVNNPVTITFEITYVNITNFLTYYNGVTFNGAYPYPLNSTNGEYTATLRFKDTGNGTYTAEGKVVWLIEGPTAPIILPNTNAQISVMSSQQPTSTTAMLTISSVSDTLAFKSSEYSVKLTWLIGSFSILLLEPLFEAIFVKERRGY